MSKTIVIVGFGSGISAGVAEKFGAEGFAVAIVARNQALSPPASGAYGKGSPRPLSRPTRRSGLGSRRHRRVRAKLGPVTVIHWNAFGGAEAGDLLTADPAARAASSTSP